MVVMPVVVNGHAFRTPPTRDYKRAPLGASARRARRRLSL